MSLEEETKKALGYKPKVDTCSTCKHIEEREETMCDRMWYDVCTYSNLSNFRVERSGTCLRHKSK